MKKTLTVVALTLGLCAFTDPVPKTYTAHYKQDQLTQALNRLNALKSYFDTHEGVISHPEAKAFMASIDSIATIFFTPVKEDSVTVKTEGAKH